MRTLIQDDIMTPNEELIMSICALLLLILIYLIITQPKKPKFSLEHAQPAPTSATGIITVYDPNGALSSVDVVMTDPNGNGVTQTTDANGQTTFTESVEGTFTVSVPAFNYSQTFEVKFGVDFSMQFGVPRELSFGKKRSILNPFKGFSFLS